MGIQWTIGSSKGYIWTIITQQLTKNFQWGFMKSKMESLKYGISIWTPTIQALLTRLNLPLHARTDVLAPAIYLWSSNSWQLNDCPSNYLTKKDLYWERWSTLIKSKRTYGKYWDHFERLMIINCSRILSRSSIVKATSLWSASISRISFSALSAYNFLYLNFADWLFLSCFNCLICSNFNLFLAV